MNTIESTGPTVDDFARAVRAAMSDLPADDVDDLTEGLEGDLAERLEDHPREPLPDPVAYADELREAAGLAPRTASRQTIWERVAEIGPNLIGDVRSTPVGAEVLEFLSVLRPVWWVLRAWAFYFIVALLSDASRATPLPGSLFGWVVLLGLVVLSVQWGRERWLPKVWLRGAETTIGVVTAVSLVFAIPISLTFASSSSAASSGDVVEYRTPGLASNGEPVRNVFAYGPDGKLIENVQLFDQDGNPLDLVDAGDQRFSTIYDSNGIESTVVPSDAVPGRVGWNVYPLRETDSESAYAEDPDSPLPSAIVRDAQPPFAEAQPLAGLEEAPLAGLEEAPLSAPGEDAAAVHPSASPSPSPSP